MTVEKKYILTKEVAEKKLRRMAFEILENNIDEKEIILAGIRDSGSVVARVIQKMLGEISSIKTDLITVTLDKKQPMDVSLSKKIDFNNKVIILTDDVSNSGKTLLYALKPFIDFHPKKIQVLVLVERTHTSFPVRPDYVGLSLATTIQEHIFVEVKDEVVVGAYLK
ncbi:MAG TPA: phosphoribosyltransferase family protein [Chitinophagaceae bacterium]|nr:phosphoribosyltransferase family protein [Chitinophagaceae bacterium]